jgi:hypothetical protein
MCSKRLAADAALALGGLRMKLVKVFCMVALLAVSAAAVKAGSIDKDPKFTINKPSGIAEPGFKSFGKNADPMFTVELEYMGPTISSLVVTLAPSADFWTGSSNIFTSVAFGGSPFGALFTGGTLTRGEFIDVILQSPGPGPFTVDFPMDFTCVESCNSGGANGLTVMNNLPNPTPEPSTILMFLSLGPAIGFAKKRWNARQSA